MSENSSVFKQKVEPNEVCAFVRFGSYSTNKSAFDTKFRVLRGVSAAELEAELSKLIKKLQNK